MISLRSSDRGFTLMETMLAVFIFGFIALTVYGVLSQAIKARTVGEERAELYALGRETVLRIASDVEGALLPLSGDRIFFAGDAARLEFVAMNRGGYGLNRIRPGQVLVEYGLDPADRGTFPPLVRLERDFKYVLNQADGIDDRAEESRFDLDDSNDVQAPVEQAQVLLECPPGTELFGLPGSCARIGGLSFRFYDDAIGEWRDYWDSFEEEGGTQDRIPDAVEIVLLLLDENGGEHDFYTIVDLPLARANPTPGEEEEEEVLP